jgi:hypothetical protein
MPLIKGRLYSWTRIVEETGADGSPPFYLLHRGCDVVAGCFTLELNPEAPLVVLAGNGPKISEAADHFCAQLVSIPVFVRSGNEDWLYCGDFRLLRQSTNPEEIRHYSARAKRADVYKILFLEEVTS